MLVFFPKEIEFSFLKFISSDEWKARMQKAIYRDGRFIGKGKNIMNYLQFQQGAPAFFELKDVTIGINSLGTQKVSRNSKGELKDHSIKWYDQWRTKTLTYAQTITLNGIKESHAQHYKLSKPATILGAKY